MVKHNFVFKKSFFMYLYNPRMTKDTAKDRKPPNSAYIYMQNTVNTSVFL